MGQQTINEPNEPRTLFLRNSRSGAHCGPCQLAPPSSMEKEAPCSKEDRSFPTAYE